MRMPWRWTCQAQRASERTGLPKATGHWRVALQELSDLGAGQSGENPVPLLKNGANLFAITSHPALEVLARDLQQAAIAAKSGCDPPILRRIALVNEPMRELSLHATSVCCLGGFDQPLKYTPNHGTDD
jgi:hypothetical protein